MNNVTNIRELPANNERKSDAKHVHFEVDFGGVPGYELLHAIQIL